MHRTPSRAPWSARRLTACLALAGALAPAAQAADVDADAVTPEAVGAITVAVDASKARRPIDPNIYGLGVGDAGGAPAADIAALNVPLVRLGGNSMTTYNWRQNATNLASDWYFESYPYAGTTPAAEVESLYTHAKAKGAKAMVTVPIIGQVAKLGANRSVLPAFSIAKYGAQQDHDYWYPDAGNGLHTDGSYVTGNDVTDAYVAGPPSEASAFVAHLVGKYGKASAGGPAYYMLDNEVSLWSSTHRDVHPVGPHATEARDRMIKYAAAIRKADPTALIAGPEEWGWLALSLSGYDQQWGDAHGWPGTYPDQTKTQGGRDYLAWLLAELKAAGRPIDVFTFHYYPQSSEFSSDVSPAVQRLRNRSTRELWDKTYVSQSWIGDKVYLIPRLAGLVAQNYWKDAKIGITEYSWGADDHINGATAQADVLGIFGREGLDLANRWGMPAAGSPTYRAIQMYRNYDGNRSVFGDVSVSAKSPRPDDLAVFAAERTSDAALTVMIVDKALAGDAGAVTKTTVSLAGFDAAGTAMVYRLTANGGLARLADRSFTGASITLDTPPQSVTLVVLPKKGSPVWQPPRADIRLSAADFRLAPPVAAKLDVDGSGSTAGSNAIRTYAWDFGDGATASGATASHTYRRYGFFVVTLTVTDAKGKIGRNQHAVTILPSANAKTSCAVKYTVPYTWGGGFSGNVHLTNTGSADVTEWVLQWTFPGDQAITDIWGGTLTANGARQIVLPGSWNHSIAAGTATDVGFNASFSGTNTAPTGFTLNGSTCTLQ